MKKHRKLQQLQFTIALIFLVGLPSVTHSQDTQAVAVIANRNNAVNNLSLAELRKILLGDRTYWSGSHKILVLMPKAGTPEWEVVVRLLHMDDAEYKKHWLAKVFAGEADGMPAVVPASGTAVALVTGSPEAIALIPASDVRGSVKIIRIDGHSPSDSAYSVR